MGKKKDDENKIIRIILLFIITIYSIFLILLIPKFYNIGGIRFIMIVITTVLSIVCFITIGIDLRTHKK